MNLIHAIILSIIEGITEFLPISSTGHLILASKLLEVASTEFTKSFEIFIQLGAIMAVTTLYWKTLITKKSLWLPLMAAFVPTAIVGLTLYPVIKGYLLENTQITVVSLFVGGLFIIGFEKYRTLDSGSGAGMTIKKAIIIGLFQSLSVIPGVSRAAATILGGMTAGLTRVEAVEFSFLLALPTMAAAVGLDLVKSAQTFEPHQYMILGLGFIVSWITAFLTVKALLAYVKTHTFTAFGVYRVILALAFAWFVGTS